MKNLAQELRQLMEQLERLQEFAPDSAGGAQSYYTSTENFINNYRQQKEEEIEEMTDGWDESEVAEVKQGVEVDIHRLQQVANGFLKGLKPGFDNYLHMDTQLKDSLGCHWIGDNLSLNDDWAKIYGKAWGNDEAC